MQQMERKKNSYPGNCSGCKKHLLKGQGYLFKNTRYLNSRGYHLKCEDCHKGVTAKRQREQEKLEKGKTLSVKFASAWLASLELKLVKTKYVTYCEVSKDGEVILGWWNFFEGGQEYPTEDWCQEQAQKLGGYFTDKAITLITNELTAAIERMLGSNLP